MAQGLSLWPPQTEAEGCSLRDLIGPNSMRLSIDYPDQESPLLAPSGRQEGELEGHGEGVCLHAEAGILGTRPGRANQWALVMEPQEEILGLLHTVTGTPWPRRSLPPADPCAKGTYFPGQAAVGMDSTKSLFLVKAKASIFSADILFFSFFFFFWGGGSLFVVVGFLFLFCLPNQYIFQKEL